MILKEHIIGFGIGGAIFLGGIHVKETYFDTRSHIAFIINESRLRARDNIITTIANDSTTQCVDREEIVNIGRKYIPKDKKEDYPWDDFYLGLANILDVSENC